MWISSDIKAMSIVRSDCWNRKKLILIIILTAELEIANQLYYQLLTTVTAPSSERLMTKNIS